LYFSVKYLGRHPKETNLSIDDFAEVAYICREIEKAENEKATAILKALMGSRL